MCIQKWQPSCVIAKRMSSVGGREIRQASIFLDHMTKYTLVCLLDLSCSSSVCSVGSSGGVAYSVLYCRSLKGQPACLVPHPPQLFSVVDTFYGDRSLWESLSSGQRPCGGHRGKSRLSQKCQWNLNSRMTC